MHRLGACQQAAIDAHRARHALAMPDAAFPAHFDFKDLVAAMFVLGDPHIAVFEVIGFIRAQPGVGHEQDEVVHLLGVPPIKIGDFLAGVFPGRFVKLLVFLGAEPWPVRALGLALIGSGEVRQMVDPPMALRGL